METFLSGVNSVQAAGNTDCMCRTRTAWSHLWYSLVGCTHVGVLGQRKDTVGVATRICLNTLQP